MDQSSKQPLDESAMLMLKAADDDIEAFVHLYQRFAPLLKQFFVIRGVDDNSADDLVQIIFARLWEQHKNYRGESSFETYLFGIARNTLKKEIRRSCTIAGISSKKQPVCDDGIYKTLSQPEAEFHLQELTDALETAKAKLTNEQRQALDVFQNPDVAFDKTSEKNICSKGAYKKRLKRARKRIKELMAQYFIDKKG